MTDQKKTEIVKRKLKKLLPFEVRHSLQILLVKYPEIRMFLMQKSLSEQYSDAFYKMLNCTGISDLKGRTVCEIGPGQYLYNAFLEYQLGAAKEYLIDIDDFANAQGRKTSYKRKDIELKPDYPSIRKLPDLENMFLKEQLGRIHAQYYTNGTDSYKNIEDGCIDVLFSNTVLQHIRKDVFEKTIKEMNRIMRTGGISYHSVDLKDMMGGLKKHLGVPSDIWEDDIHYKMACYTNRLQCNEMCRIFRKNGFAILKVRRRYFKELPVRKQKLAKEFTGITDRELMTSGFTILLKKVNNE